eukprot:NODE_2573_length_2187_cov_6.466019.p1 GENE.NODE_2573_length_2187_cov_6.466019~~NODE_2573_length_2187_cov_6.466019.p1  ORF type:complete len:366 (+),score=119.06 NODE_2573_length_2187_cov_6.466019:1076-2173(+)
MRELMLAKESLEQELKTARADVQQLKVEADHGRRRMKKQVAKMRTLLAHQFGVFRECSALQAEIPLLKRDEAALDKVTSRNTDLDELPFVELECLRKALDIDFGKLPEERRSVAERTPFHEVRDARLEYEERLADIVKELDQLNPNMSAPEQCAAEAEKLKDIQKQGDEACLESARLTRSFEAVKTERQLRFMNCFKHVENRLQPYYKELTSYDEREGGAAYLDLDDADEPYNGGVTFTACPPGKRFFPMDLLSGGEKSMASMALLFAMHSFQPPPFMILDEVDAPFDRKNTNSLVTYLKKLEFQVLVISLKDSFFAHSDSIVGIYKDRELQTSGFLMLALRTLSTASEQEEDVFEAPRPIGDAE